MKKIIFSLLGLAVLIALALPAASPVVVSAGDVWPDCNWVCEAADVRAERVWLGDEYGNELVPCTPGENVTAHIWFECYNNANNPRYALIVLGNITINHELQTSLDECVLDSIAAQNTTRVDVYSFNWTCGDVVEIRNLVLSVEPSETTCANATRTCAARTAKCYSAANITPEAPLIVDFEFDNVCFCTNTTFTDKTTGGNGTYSWNWTFGDGGNSSQQNPSYHYGSPGTYNVTLNVTDSAANSGSRSHNVTVWPNPACNISCNPADCTICQGESITLTETGGEGDTW